jgi:REP element-mobilizing transposase RayT
MNRGRRSEKIFYDWLDYKMFVQLLEETSEMWNIRISAYYLMPNHYHILLQTPDANIARSMRHRRNKAADEKGSKPERKNW